MLTKLHESAQTYIRPEYFFFAAVFLSLLFVLTPEEEMLSRQEAAAGESVRLLENPYDALELIAKAAYVYDSREKKSLFEKDAHELLPLASITKIMTAFTALSLIPETTYISIDEEAIREEGDSGFAVGERWLLRDLLTYMLLESSNDGAAAVSSAIGEIFEGSGMNEKEYKARFVAEMNALAMRSGLLETYFLNESGLDIGEAKAGAYSTAAEAAELLRLALEKFPDLFTETRLSELVLENEEGQRRAARNTNTNLTEVPLLMASKTGYTDLAGGNLVIAFDAGFNRPIIISVLGSTMDGRFTDAEKLVCATLEALGQNSE